MFSRSIFTQEEIWTYKLEKQYHPNVPLSFTNLPSSTSFRPSGLSVFPVKVRALSHLIKQDLKLADIEDNALKYEDVANDCCMWSIEDMDNRALILNVYDN